MKIPVMGGIGIGNLSVSELWMCELLAKLVCCKKGAFVDIGVNEGQTLLKLKTVNSTVDYVGFEPNSKCIYYTSALIKANNFQNCRILPVGVFNDNTILQLNLYTAADTDLSASLVEDFRPNEKVYDKMFVAVNTFEKATVSLNLKEISVIKIDVEGAEMEVLQSLEQTLQQHRPSIIIEILPVYSNEVSGRLKRQQTIELFLKKLNYNIFRVIKSDDEKSIKKFERLTSIGIHDDTNWCEYVMLPEELTDVFFSN